LPSTKEGASVAFLLKDEEEMHRLADEASSLLLAEVPPDYFVAKDGGDWSWLRACGVSFPETKEGLKAAFRTRDREEIIRLKNQGFGALLEEMDSQPLGREDLLAFLVQDIEGECQDSEEGLLTAIRINDEKEIERLACHGRTFLTNQVLKACEVNDQQEGDDKEEGEDEVSKETMAYFLRCIHNASLRRNTPFYEQCLRWRGLGLQFESSLRGLVASLCLEDAEEIARLSHFSAEKEEKEEKEEEEGGANKGKESFLTHLTLSRRYRNWDLAHLLISHGAQFSPTPCGFMAALKLNELAVFNEQTPQEITKSLVSDLFLASSKNFTPSSKRTSYRSSESASMSSKLDSIDNAQTRRLLAAERKNRDMSTTQTPSYKPLSSKEIIDFAYYPLSSQKNALAETVRVLGLPLEETERGFLIACKLNLERELRRLQKYRGKVLRVLSSDRKTEALAEEVKQILKARN
jgi:hypothetical protein